MATLNIRPARLFLGLDGKKIGPDTVLGTIETNLSIEEMRSYLSSIQHDAIVLEDPDASELDASNLDDSEDPEGEGSTTSNDGGTGKDDLLPDNSDPEDANQKWAELVSTFSSEAQVSLAAAGITGFTRAKVWVADKKDGFVSLKGVGDKTNEEIQEAIAGFDNPDQ